MDYNTEPQNQSLPDSGTGYLIVKVSTARGAIPLEGAVVNIRSYNPGDEQDPAVKGDILASLISGTAGKTQRILLKAPPRSVSEAPSAQKPYSLYQAEVSLEGYYTQTYIGIPIFDGITAVQPAVLIPLSENGTSGIPRAEDVRFFEGYGPNL